SRIRSPPPLLTTNILFEIEVLQISSPRRQPQRSWLMRLTACPLSSCHSLEGHLADRWHNLDVSPTRDATRIRDSARTPLTGLTRECPSWPSPGQAASGAPASSE